MRQEKCLTLAEFAKQDKSLITNHRNGRVDFFLRKHLAEVNELLSIVVEDPEFVATLRDEKIELESALLVYA